MNSDSEEVKEEVTEKEDGSSSTSLKLEEEEKNEQDFNTDQLVDSTSTENDNTNLQNTGADHHEILNQNLEEDISFNSQDHYSLNEDDHLLEKIEIRDNNDDIQDNIDNENEISPQMAENIENTQENTLSDTFESSNTSKNSENIEVSEIQPTENTHDIPELEGNLSETSSQKSKRLVSPKRRKKSEYVLDLSEFDVVKSIFEKEESKDMPKPKPKQKLTQTRGRVSNPQVNQSPKQEESPKNRCNKEISKENYQNNLPILSPNKKTPKIVSPKTPKQRSYSQAASPNKVKKVEPEEIINDNYDDTPFVTELAKPAQPTASSAPISQKQKKRRPNSYLIPPPPKYFSPLPVRKPINLQQYDRSDPLPDDSTIPKELLSIIKYEPPHIVYRALCLENISTYSKSVVSEVIKELKDLEKLCIKKNLLNGTQYVDYVIDCIKEDTAKPEQEDKRGEIYEQRITKAESQLKKKAGFWADQRASLAEERELALDELELAYEEGLQKMNDEWHSEKMQDRYNKPSGKLLGLRAHFQIHLESHRFDEAALIAQEIEALEQEEVEAAMIRMKKDYQGALEKAKTKYKSDRANLELLYDSKENGLSSREQEAMRPIEARLSSLKQQKENHEVAKKRLAKAPKADGRKKPPALVAAPKFTLHSKLKLPPLKM